MDAAALRLARRGGVASDARSRQRRAVACWLLALAGLVLAMVVLGGITRLNHAGLSIVDWRPLMGVLPPFGEDAWQALFADYKRFPEYQEINRGMTLDAFKEIFWLEYAHRLLGRIVGIAFALPFVWFLIRRAFDRALALKVLAIGILGGLQGLLGWYMVKSGLVDRPDVSPYRLAAHLGLAVAIYGCLIWVALGLVTGGAVERVRRAGRWRSMLWGATGLVFLTILSGAFVAGNDAGLAYNTFPLMADAIVPPDVFLIEPLWRNFFENVPLVQLDHRLLAMLTALAVILIWAAALRWLERTPVRAALHAAAAAVLVQFVLGIATLLTFVPVPLGAAHQAGAMVVFTAILAALRLLYPPAPLTARPRPCGPSRSA
ncbi:MAG: COX15/CtaA family protein [Rhodospirillales bacterium]|nr:COX15/CtaA family protein [Rhodospirillales bacterium]MDE0381053.1 COX15/CtaA family protein [Rhodospirillales bacterium]